MLVRGQQLSSNNCHVNSFVYFLKIYKEKKNIYLKCIVSAAEYWSYYFRAK